VSFGRYDECFLEHSWHWLNDPEIKRLTMTPDFTRDEQLRWFARLAEMKDYLIWGITYDATPIGALGLKHITKDEAEYWGYVGDRRFWGVGLGREMMRFSFNQARELCLSRLRLKVQRDNARAIRLYAKSGFRTLCESDGVLTMQVSLRATHEP
jgi:RimJ/RimL family protein N-acetyltransferase